MGAGGVPNRGVEIVYDRNLKKVGKPNIRVDKYKNGEKIQSRWYDKDGRAIRNRDYKHSGNMNFPHDHKWDWSKEDPRGKEHLDPDFDNFK